MNTKTKSRICTLAWMALSTIPLFAADTTTGSQEEKTEAALRDRFTSLDTNNDGFLSREEYLASEWSHKNPGRAEAMFKYKDKDNDGQLTFDEFKAQAQVPWP